jgi:hypothetical protein
MLAYRGRMPTRYSHRPVRSLAEMNEALVDLVHTTMWRWDDRTSYKMCELWSKEPPERLGKTLMAGQLDIIVGFHLSEEELRTAYKFTDITASAFYLYNLMLHKQSMPFVQTSQNENKSTSGQHRKK